jgi:hypothetical protein
MTPQEITPLESDLVLLVDESYLNSQLPELQIEENRPVEIGLAKDQRQVIYVRSGAL